MSNNCMQLQNLQLQKLIEVKQQQIQNQQLQKKNKQMVVDLKRLEDQQSRKCDYCSFQATKEKMLKHVKSMHKEEFLEQGDNAEKYQICEHCNKLLRTTNIEQHSFLCAYKQLNEKNSQQINLLNKMNNKRRFSQIISIEEQDKQYNQLMESIGITKDNIQNCEEISRDVNYNQDEMEKSIFQRKLFFAVKNQKPNDDSQMSEILNSTQEKSVNSSILNGLDVLNLEQQNNNNQQ